MFKPNKSELIENYSRREPKRFIQIDGWHGGKWANDGIITTDEQGRSMTGGETFELMLGSDVRVLIDPDTPPAEVAALLKNAASFIESGILSEHWKVPSTCQTCGQEQLRDCDRPF